jgi:outer membrane biosynthesis protein TonB
MERNRDRRKIWWAVLASLFVHVLIGLSLAAFGGKLQSTPPDIEEQPPQLTIIEETPTPPPLVPKNPLMTTVDESQKSAVAPKEKTFEANENSIAASEKAATEQNFLPSQGGKNLPFMNLQNHAQSFAHKGEAPKPTPKPTPGPSASPQVTPTPNESVAPTPTPPPDQLAFLTQTPTPIPSPSVAAQNNPIPTPNETPRPQPSETPLPSSEYRDLQQQTVIRGGITNRGRSAVNAVGTPLGRYKKEIEDAIGSRWYYYINAHADLASIGTTMITFDIGPDGSINNMRVTQNTTTEATASIALRSIQETKFPPIPDELLPTLPDGHFTMEESFTIFANR